MRQKSMVKTGWALAAVFAVGVVASSLFAAGPNDVDSLLIRAGAKRGEGPSVFVVPFRFSVKPICLPTGGGLASIGVTVIPGYDCGLVRLDTDLVDNLEFLAFDPESISAGKNDSVFVELQVNIPSNDTSGVVVRAVGANGSSARVPIYFVSTSDSVRCHVAFRGELEQIPCPEAISRSWTPQSRLESDVGDGPWECLLDLQDPRDYASAKQIVDSLTPCGNQGVYRATIDMETYHKLREIGIHVRPLPPEKH